MVRFFATFINILAAIATIITLSMVQIEFSHSDISAIMTSNSFESTDTFNNILKERMDESFTLINLKKVFETNNKLNYDALVAESLDKENGIKKWTINDCLNEAKKHGLLIDTDYTVILVEDNNTIPFSRSPLYNFMLKLYPSTVRTGAQSEEDFLTEFMQTLAKYHKASRNLTNNLTNFKYIVDFQDELGERSATYKNTDLTKKEMLDSPIFIYVSSRENIVSSSINSISSQNLNELKDNNPHPDMDFDVYYAIDDSYQAEDAFKVAYTNYVNTKYRCATLVTTCILSGILFIITLIINLMLVLRIKKNVEEDKSILARIPTEIFVFVYIFVTAVFIYIAGKVTSNPTLLSYNFSSASYYFYVLAVYVPTIILMELFATKYANDTLSLSSLRAIKDNVEGNNNTINPRSLFFGTLVPIISFLAISVYLIHLFSMTSDIKILVIAFFIFVATLSFTIYILYLYREFNKAIAAEARSNEMRTTLITNVTHDIKTPLTSILNYAEIITDEIKNPNKDSKENLIEYSNALINKSNRLNELINDLIFDSKVTSGNIELDMQKIDLNAFINQLMAEFSDRLAEKGLKVIYENKAKNTYISADSAQLYRVFQNLFSNIYKYALENSRVYVDLKTIKSKIKITIKNIQKEKLETDVTTLKNRFVRGSKSRSTEGFGLGLSIADNLITLMNGSFEIKSVKDEFTATITFLTYEE